jgi:hypothetical protein
MSPSLPLYFQPFTLYRSIEKGHPKVAFFNSGGRIRTSDLRVMSPTSYQAALPRDLVRQL